MIGVAAGLVVVRISTGGDNEQKDRDNSAFAKGHAPATICDWIVDEVFDKLVRLPCQTP
jgi:hypothetical protein